MSKVPTELPNYNCSLKNVLKYILSGLGLVGGNLGPMGHHQAGGIYWGKPCHLLSYFSEPLGLSGVTPLSSSVSEHLFLLSLSFSGSSLQSD